MLKKWRKRAPLLYCIGVELLDVVVMWLGVNLAALALWLVGWYGAAEESYLLTLMQELFSAATVLVILRLTGRTAVLRNEGCGVMNGLLAAMPLWVMICLSVTSIAISQLTAAGGVALCSGPEILIFLLTVFMVGVAEEGLARGIIAQTLLEHYGTSRRGVFRAVVVSGLMFGGMHLLNLSGSAASGVLIQCAISAVFGMLQAAVYFRTGNLWVPILLHAALDFSALMEGGLYVGASLSETVSGYSAAQLPQILIYLIPTLWLLRPAKLAEVRLYMRSTWEEKPDAAA